MKVGDYVKFKDKRENTYIRKIVEIPEDNRYASIYIDKDANYSNGLSPKNIIKSSPNIIDLIEVGDYVNGQLVKHIAYFEGVEEPIKKLIFSDEYHLIPTEVCEQNEIKSIVTKEQFESMEYEVI